MRQQIALIRKGPVERGRRVSEERFLQAPDYCILPPEPEATRLAIYVGC